MATNDTMFSSVYDAATADNLSIKDNATRAAQAGRGMVGAQANALAGGMFAKGLAKMAGMQTPAQKKAEIITDVLKGTQNLNRDDPASYKKIAQAFLQRGLPGEAQKFLDKAREIEVENRTYKLNQGTLAVQQGTLTLAEKTQQDDSNFMWKGFENSKYEFETNMSFKEKQQSYQAAQDTILNNLSARRISLDEAMGQLAENDQKFNQSQTAADNAFRDKTYNLDALRAKANIALGWAEHGLAAEQYKWGKYVDINGMAIDKKKLDFEVKTQAIMNKLANENLSIDKAKLLLSQNELTFAKERSTITDTQWNKKYSLEKLVAEAEVKAKEADTAMQQLQNAQYPKSVALDKLLTESQISSNNTKIVDNVLYVKDADSNSYHRATKADGSVLQDHEEAKEFGMTADAKRMVDLVWKEYEKLYYTGGSLYEDAKWTVPESLQYSADNPNGLKEVPSFQEFAKMSIENGGHGGQANVVKALESAYGGPGSYEAELFSKAKINRKSDEIVLGDSTGSFTMKFDIGQISEDFSLPSELLSAVRVGTTENPNADKDTNAQTIAELQHMVEVSTGTNKEGYTAMLTDFVKSITPTVEVEDEPPAELGVTVEAEEQVIEEATPEALEKISEKRTNAAIKATGITEGSWQVKNGPVRDNPQSAKYKMVDGVRYEWKAKDSGSVSLGDVTSEAYQSFTDQFSSLDTLIDSLNPFK